MSSVTKFYTLKEFTADISLEEIKCDVLKSYKKKKKNLFNFESESIENYIEKLKKNRKVNTNKELVEYWIKEEGKETVEELQEWIYRILYYYKNTANIIVWYPIKGSEKSRSLEILGEICRPLVDKYIENKKINI